MEELALPESEDDASGSEQDANVDVTVASADDVDADDPDTDQLAEPDTMIDLDDELDAEGEVDAEDYMDVEGEMDISAASKRLTARQAALVAGGSNMDHVMLRKFIPLSHLGTHAFVNLCSRCPKQENAADGGRDGSSPE